MTRYKLDPSSPTGISPVETPIISRQQTNGYVTKIEFLDELKDIDLSTSPTDDQVLAYDSATGKWIPQTITGGGGTGDGVTKAFVIAMAVSL